MAPEDATARLPPLDSYLCKCRSNGVPSGDPGECPRECVPMFVPDIVKRRMKSGLRHAPLPLLRIHSSCIAGYPHHLRGACFQLAERPPCYTAA